MIIAVDGACPGNGFDKAIASGCGIWFGNKSYTDETWQPNGSFRVLDDPDCSHTSQRAELHAAIVGLAFGKRFAERGGQWPCDVPTHCSAPCPITHLVIKTDSAYLVNGITQSVYKWQQNGWLTVKKTPVKNRDLWEKLVDGVRTLNELDVHVDFWLVPREKTKKLIPLPLSEFTLMKHSLTANWGFFTEVFGCSCQITKCLRLARQKR